MVDNINFVYLERASKALDRCINDAATGSVARALYAAKEAVLSEVETMYNVQPVKHGYWKEEEPRVLKCSVCGEYAPMNYLGQNCIDSRYCPWCGTKMDSNADEPWQSE